MMFAETKADDPDLFTVKEFHVTTWRGEEWRVEVWHLVKGDVTALHLDIPMPPRDAGRMDALHWCIRQLSLYRRHHVTEHADMAVDFLLPETLHEINGESVTYELRVQRL